MFETVGSFVESAIASYAQQISGSLISSLSPVILVCVTLYFTLKGYMFMTGRADGALPDTVISAFKIALIAYIGLNTGNFLTYGINWINSCESFLTDTLPGSPSNSWATIDNMWNKMGEAFALMFGLMKPILEMGWSSLGKAIICGFFLLIGMIIYLIAAAFLTMAALGVILLAKISLVLTVGFGPLFICMLMFPITRSWFDGWLKSCLTYVFTLVMMAGVMALVTKIFDAHIDHISKIVNDAQGMADGSFAKFFTNLFAFLIVSVTLGAVVKAVPSMAAGIVGGVAMQAVGLAAMMNSQAQGAVSAAGVSKMAAGNLMGDSQMAREGQVLMRSAGYATALGGAARTANLAGSGAAWAGREMSHGAQTVLQFAREDTSLSTVSFRALKAIGYNG